MVIVRGWWIAALAVAAVLAIVVIVHPGPLPGEVGYVRWWQDRGEPVPRLADVVRATTGTEAALLIWALPMLWLLARGGRPGMLAVVVVLATMLVAQPLLKEVVDRPRPTAEQVEVRVEHESMSFPSGHSMSTATVWGAAAGTAWATGRRKLAVAAAVPVVLTFFASAVHGVHWPSDAIAGTLLGAVAAWVAVGQVTSIDDLSVSPTDRSPDRRR